MRNLVNNLPLSYLQQIKSEIVPTLFTEHQFQIIQKKRTKQSLTASQRNELSRLNKRLQAIYTFANKQQNTIYTYNQEKIIPARLKKAIQLIKHYSRKFKHKHLLITGSFLYNQKYNDIDLFVITEYDKEDDKEDHIHINYMNKDVYSSLFFTSVQKLCISNRELFPTSIQEAISLDTFISLYQEIIIDIEMYPHAIKQTLKDFLLQSAFLSYLAIPDSKELNQTYNTITQSKNMKGIINNLFVQTIILYNNTTETNKTLNSMIQSYQELSKEYPQHQQHYQETINTFQKVIQLVS